MHLTGIWPKPGAFSKAADVCGETSNWYVCLFVVFGGGGGMHEYNFALLCDCMYRTAYVLDMHMQIRVDF
jgi:hypothetical protein